MGRILTARVGPPDGRSYTVDIPVDERSLADAVEEILTEPNIRYLREHPETPSFASLAKAGVIRYGADPDEWWLSIPYCLGIGVIDCEDAAGWLSAEDRVRGLDSRPAVYRAQKGTYHVVVARMGPVRSDEITIGALGKCTLIDPARMIGMGKHHKRRR